ncbi:unnamed protein product [Dovyalis caffra]|uniref:Glutathione S-transferase n=1 Tax=Dovyalis caffra TaxID=77055 RepID=A0AAV1QYH4_9ROSI|nr:unnamed protein product [Dovyalis caffra]
MEETKRVRLHGMWHSTYSKRVEMALKIKDIPYEYVEEDLRNKSSSLLHTPRLLPDDPHPRSKVRFWASFIQQQLFESTGKFIRSDGEAQEKAREEVLEKMKVFEEGIKEFFAEDIRTIDDTKLGFMDILVSTTFSSYKAYEQVLGVKVLEPEKNPLLFTWVTSLNKLPIVQELLPPDDKLVAILQSIRQNALQSSN